MVEFPVVRTLVVAPWQGRRQGRGKGGELSPLPIFGPVNPNTTRWGLILPTKFLLDSHGLPDLPTALLGGGGLEKHYCWGCSFSQKKWIPSHATVVNNSRHIAIDTHLFTALVWRKIICQIFFAEVLYQIRKILRFVEYQYLKSCH